MILIFLLLFLLEVDGLYLLKLVSSFGETVVFLFLGYLVAGTYAETYYYQRSYHECYQQVGFYVFVLLGIGGQDEG